MSYMVMVSPYLSMLKSGAPSLLVNSILLSINSTMPLGTPKDIMNLLEQKEEPCNITVQH